MEGLDEVKAWAMGLVFGPAMAMLLWYFKRSQGQIDARLDGLDNHLDEVRELLAKKIERDDMVPVWEKLRLQDQDIKNLGASFSRELREQIDSLRLEQNNHQRQTTERLDRIIMLIKSDNHA